MNHTKRLFLYLVGLAALALGSVLSVFSDLGVTASSSIGYVLSEMSGISFGKMTIINFCIYIALQMILTVRKNYLQILLQLPFSLVFSALIDMMIAGISFEVHSPVQQALLMLLGILFTSIGVFFTVGVRIVPTAPDGIVQAISDRFHWRFANVKNVFDLLLVISAAILGLIFKGKLTGIGAGTVVSAVLIGRVVKVLEKKLSFMI